MELQLLDVQIIRTLILIEATLLQLKLADQAIKVLLLKTQELTEIVQQELLLIIHNHQVLDHQKVIILTRQVVLQIVLHIDQIQDHIVVVHLLVLQADLQDQHLDDNNKT